MLERAWTYENNLNMMFWVDVRGHIWTVWTMLGTVKACPTFGPFSIIVRSSLDLSHDFRTCWDDIRTHPHNTRTSLIIVWTCLGTFWNHLKKSRHCSNHGSRFRPVRLKSDRFSLDSTVTRLEFAYQSSFSGAFKKKSDLFV